MNNPWIYHFRSNFFLRFFCLPRCFLYWSVISVLLLALVVFSIGSRCGRRNLRIRGGLRFQGFRYLCGFSFFPPASSLLVSVLGNFGCNILHWLRGINVRVYAR